MKSRGDNSDPASRPRGTPGLEARRAALGILLRVERDRAYADVLLGNRLDAFAPDDRRLITMLVMGTLAWRARLNFELARLSSRPLKQINPAILEILRLGLFQIRFLDRMPKHAAVDTAVALAHEHLGARATGFVNAILRSAARSQPALPERGADEIEYLAIALSHPRWMVQKFVAAFGAPDAERLIAADNEAAPNAIRLNLARAPREELIARISADGMEIAREGIFPETIILNGAPRFDSESFRAGLFHPQSEASQVIARLLAPDVGTTVADCAAAPGGKATHLAEIVGERGRVVALDRNQRGLVAAESVARRLGHRNAAFVRADTSSAIPLRPGSIDFVLLDAPCTGSGTLREHPEAKWRLSPEDPARMSTVQRAMLENAATLVRSGGAIVYSVCSLFPEEGPEVAADFLTSHPEFAADTHPPGYDRLRELIRPDGSVLMRPDKGGYDGFYAVRLIRK